MLTAIFCFEASNRQSCFVCGLQERKLHSIGRASFPAIVKLVKFDKAKKLALETSAVPSVHVCCLHFLYPHPQRAPRNVGEWLLTEMDGLNQVIPSSRASNPLQKGQGPNHSSAGYRSVSSY